MPLKNIDSTSKKQKFEYVIIMIFAKFENTFKRMIDEYIDEYFDKYFRNKNDIEAWKEEIKKNMKKKTIRYENNILSFLKTNAYIPGMLKIIKNNITKNISLLELKNIYIEIRNNAVHGELKDYDVNKLLISFISLVYLLNFISKSILFGGKTIKRTIFIKEDSYSSSINFIKSFLLEKK